MTPKLTPEQRTEICERYAAGARQKTLAKEYGVSAPTISYIVRAPVRAWRIQNELLEWAESYAISNGLKGVDQLVFVLLMKERILQHAAKVQGK